MVLIKSCHRNHSHPYKIAVVVGKDVQEITDSDSDSQL